LREWLRQERNVNGGREEYRRISRIGHDPDGKAATVLRDGDLLRWIDEVPGSRAHMELFEYGCGHGG
jgi:hypothetical protein